MVLGSSLFDCFIILRLVLPEILSILQVGALIFYVRRHVPPAKEPKWFIFPC